MTLMITSNLAGPQMEEVLSDNDPSISYFVQSPWCTCQIGRSGGGLRFCEDLLTAMARAYGWKVDGIDSSGVGKRGEPLTPAQVPQALRSVVVEIVDKKDSNVTHLVYLPYCSCPAFRWYDNGAEPYFCKHLVTRMARMGRMPVLANAR